MQRRVMAVVLGVSSLAVALVGSASEEDASTTTGPSTGPERPSYHFAWDDVRAADAAPVATFSQGPSDTCRGHVTTSIRIGADESGIKSLTLFPVADEPCAFTVHATMRESTDAEAYARDVDAAMNVSGCCLHDGHLDAEDDHTSEEGSSSGAEDIRLDGWCRLADGWSHTGYPDPPTVVYTRIYHEMEFCYNDHEASIGSFQGYCFANQASEWYTDPDECYWEDAELGPAAQVYLTIHGYFEKHVNHPYHPYHDMWHTLNGDSGDGDVYCTGEIVGDYDGYAHTHHCGASLPEPQ